MKIRRRGRAPHYRRVEDVRKKRKKEKTMNVDGVFQSKIIKKFKKK